MEFIESLVVKLAEVSKELLIYNLAEPTWLFWVAPWWVPVNKYQVPVLSVDWDLNAWPALVSHLKLFEFPL